MTLIRSISGIRGTIGGEAGTNLTPIDIVKYTSAFSVYLERHGKGAKAREVMVGRDGRVSGTMVKGLVMDTLCSMGWNVNDQGLTSTPTLAYGVQESEAVAGVMVTASHNPTEWNALKFFNERGEFISPEAGQEVLDIADDGGFEFSGIEGIGNVRDDDPWGERHIEAVVEHELVDGAAIRDRALKIVVDGINSAGGVLLPDLLEKLGCDVVLLNGECDVKFAHDPEPLEKNLSGVMQAVTEHRSDLGIVVDPDVDRLAFIDENGAMFGEEYTLVAVADHVLSYRKGPAVSNLSSTRALKDIAEKHGCSYEPAAVGEVNVVEKMREIGAVIGGEGNGGVIDPSLHYGRDALIGVALFLSYLVSTDRSCSELRKALPDYRMVKDKVALTPELDVDRVLSTLQEQYRDHPQNVEDGLRVDFEEGWVHIRRSNTEPILRVYAEAATTDKAQAFVQDVDQRVKAFVEQVGIR